MVKKCSICKKDATGAFNCPNCSNIYCCSNHRDQDRGHRIRRQPNFPSECEQMMEAMQNWPRFRLYPNSFTWTNTLVETGLDKCALLQSLGVHKKGVWKRECGCFKDDAFGSHAPLIKDLWAKSKEDCVTVTREELKDKLPEEWWGNLDIKAEADHLLTTTSKHTQNMDTWFHYDMHRRNPDLKSPLPILLDTTMNIYQSYWKLVENHNAPKEVVIYLLGVEKEIDQWPLLLELGSLLPDKIFKVYMIGPAVPSWANNKSIHVPSISLVNAADSATTLDGGMATSMKFTFIKGSYEKLYKKLEDKPHIAFAQNAGIGHPGYTWVPDGLNALCTSMVDEKFPKVFLCTDYVQPSIQMSGANFQIVMHEICRKQRLASVPVAGSWMSKKSPHLNEFRKPVLATQVNHGMPFGSNAFGLFASVIE